MLAVPPARNELGSVVLVTLDGVRWQEIFHGVDRALAHAQDMDESEVRSAAAITPNLHRLMLEEGAAIGDASARHARGDVRASGPVFVSLPGYIEIVTGSRRSG